MSTISLPDCPFPWLAFVHQKRREEDAHVILPSAEAGSEEFKGQRNGETSEPSGAYRGIGPKRGPIRDILQVRATCKTGCRRFARASSLAQGSTRTVLSAHDIRGASVPDGDGATYCDDTGTRRAHSRRRAAGYVLHNRARRPGHGCFQHDAFDRPWWSGDIRRKLPVLRATPGALDTLVRGHPS